MIDAYYDGGAQPLSNLLPNSNFNYGSGTWATATTNASWSTEPAISCAATADGLLVTKNVDGRPGNAFYTDLYNTRAGQQYTISALARLVAGSTTFGMHLRINGASYIGNNDLAHEFTLTNTWQRLVGTGVATYSADGTSFTRVFLRFGEGSGGSQVLLRDVMLVEGPDPGYYADGDTPGWKWTGATGLTPSVGYPLPPNFIPDSFGMTGWSGGGSYTQTIPAAHIYASNDARLVPGCPMPYVYVVNQFDNRLSSTAKWYPTNLGYQSWLIEGWAAAPAAISNNLNLEMRFGNAYQNTPPTCDYLRIPTYTSFIPALTAASYRSWTHFRAIATFTIPDGAFPFLTPNFGGPDWQIAGISIRRAVQGDTNSY